jgi:hypothetical protein
MKGFTLLSFIAIKASTTVLSTRETFFHGHTQAPSTNPYLKASRG